MWEIETQNLRPLESYSNIDIVFNFKNFYQLNPYGVIMATYNELNEILLAADKAVEIYLDMKADGSITWGDLITESSDLFELSGLIKDAITFENPIVFADLTETEQKTLIVDLFDVVFNFLGVKPTGEATATYNELKEIVTAIDKGSALFAKFTADGKITATDFLVNLGDVIDFSSAVQTAVKLNGVINFSDLSSEQIKTLATSLFDDILNVVKSIKNLGQV